jgi:hypothetical protein
MYPWTCRDNVILPRTMLQMARPTAVLPRHGLSVFLGMPRLVIKASIPTADISGAARLGSSSNLRSNSKCRIKSLAPVCWAL